MYAPAQAVPSKFFSYAVAVYLVIVVSRVHETIGPLSALRPALLAAAAAVVLLLTQWQRLPWRKLAENTTARWMAVISILAILSTPRSYWPGHSAGFMLTVFPQLLLMLMLGALAFNHRPTLWLCVSAVAFGSVLAACLALPAQMAAGGRYEIGGTYDANETGALFVIALPILFMLAGEKGRIRVFALLGIPILLAGLVRTGSRGAVVGLAMLMPFFIAYAPPRRRGLYVVLIAVSAVVFGATASDDLRQRMTGLFSGSDYNFTEREGRQAVWKRGIGYMVSNPVLGVGVDAFPFAEGATLGNEGRGIKFSAAHNAYIQIGAELGILGGIAFIAALVSAAVGCLRARRRAVARVNADPQERRHEISVTTAALGSLIGAMVTAMFLSLAYSNLMFFVLALGIGVAMGSDGATSGALPAAALPGGGRAAGGRSGRGGRGGR